MKNAKIVLLSSTLLVSLIVGTSALAQDIPAPPDVAAPPEDAEVTPTGERRWSLRRQTELHLIH